MVPAKVGPITIASSMISQADLATSPFTFGQTSTLLLGNVSHVPPFQRDRKSIAPTPTTCMLKLTRKSDPLLRP